jgi:hypothetical protein
MTPSSNQRVWTYYIIQLTTQPQKFLGHGF